MKYIKLFKTEAEYNAATFELPNISYVSDTGNVHYNPKHAIDRRINAPLMNVAVANGWAKESNDYLTFDEAKLINTIYLKDFNTYEVVSAWELKYFTNLTTFNKTDFSSACSTLKYLWIPDSVTNLFTPTTSGNSFAFPSLVKLHLGEGQTKIRTEYTSLVNSRADFDKSIIYIGSNITGRDGNPSGIMRFKTFIWKATPFALADDNATNVAACNYYIDDAQVDTLKALTPFSRAASNVKPLSEYTGDLDY